MQLEVCTDPNFGGACSIYVQDNVDLSSYGGFGLLSGPGMGNDDMSSMCVQWLGTPPGTPCAPATGPQTDPAVTDRTQTTMAISWTPGTGGNYQEIDVCEATTPGGPGTQCSVTLPHDATSFSLTGLQADQKYGFHVCNVQVDGTPQEVTCSNLVNARTLPPAPSNLTAVSVSGTGIEIKWDTNITDPASVVTYSVARDGTQVVTGLVPFRPNVVGACPYIYNPLIDQTDPCAAYFKPQPYPSGWYYMDSFTTTDPHYDYTVCAVDSQDDVVQACASFTVDVHLIDKSPYIIPPLGQ